MKRLLISVLLAALTAMVYAQGPDLGMVGKSVLGIDGTATLEVSLPLETSYNPAAMNLAMMQFGEKRYSEADYGVLDFQAGPRVTNTWLVGAVYGQGWTLRLARYGIDSNSRQTKFAGAGTDVSFIGETYELAVASEVLPRFNLGAVWVAEEEITTTLTSQGYLLARDKASSDKHWRGGALCQASSTVNVGLVYGENRNSSELTLYPPMTGEPLEIMDSARFDTKLVTVGIGYQPIPGTILSANWQQGNIQGPNLDGDIDLMSFGARQYLTPDFSLNAALNDRAWNYGANYARNGLVLGACYSPSTYRSARDYLGEAQVWYLWAGKSW